MAARCSEECIDGMARNTLNTLIMHRLNPNWDGSFIHYQTSKARLLGDDNDVDLIRRADVRLARQFNSGPWVGEFSAVVENVFSNPHEEFADYNTLKRRARVSVKLDF